MDQIRDAGQRLQELLLRPALNLHAQCHRSISLALHQIRSPSRSSSAPDSSATAAASSPSSDYHFCVCPSPTSAATQVLPLASISHAHNSQPSTAASAMPQEVASLGLAPSFIAPRLQVSE